MFGGDAPSKSPPTGRPEAAPNLSKPSPDLEPKPENPEASFSPEGSKTLVDVTCGGGGHSAALLQRFSPQRHLVLDRDREALDFAVPQLQALARARGTDFRWVHAPFAQLAEVLQELAHEDPHWGRPDAILADLGVSSHQLDAGERGFSFRQDAPLDMRMDQSQGESAAALLARVSPAELTRILRDFGQESDAPRIAAALVQNPPQSTLELAQRVEQAMSAVQRRKIGMRVHPATKCFQALRIAVNQEFSQLQDFLQLSPGLLAPGGRLSVITFHSLEDKMVKNAFRKNSRVQQPPAALPIPADQLPRPDFTLPRPFHQGVDASPAEIAQNPRSRSARLRVLERLCSD